MKSHSLKKRILSSKCIDVTRVLFVFFIFASIELGVEKLLDKAIVVIYIRARRR
jgi:hypothetical protein